MKIGKLSLRVLLVSGILGACNEAYGVKKNKQNFLTVPTGLSIIPEELSTLRESSELPNSLSQSQNKSIAPGGTPKSVSISISFVPASTLKGEQERHFHFTLQELACLADEGPVKSTTSHKTEPPRKPVIIIDDEACQVRNEQRENEFTKDLGTTAKQVIVQADERSALKNESVKNKSGNTQLSRCSLLRCLSSCFGTRG